MSSNDCLWWTWVSILQCKTQNEIRTSHLGLEGASVHFLNAHTYPSNHLTLKKVTQKSDTTHIDNLWQRKDTRDPPMTHVEQAGAHVHFQMHIPTPSTHVKKSSLFMNNNNITYIYGLVRWKIGREVPQELRFQWWQYRGRQHDCSNKEISHTT